MVKVTSPLPPFVPWKTTRLEINMAAAFEELLGPTLLGKSGEVATKDALADKEVVGLYFSAHWVSRRRQ